MALTSKTDFLKNKLIVLVIFSIVAFAIYSHTISFPFYFDDYDNIENNSALAISDLSLKSLKGAAFTNLSGVRPLSYFTFALNYYYSGLNTASYRVVNIIIHLINAFLIYLVILRMFNYSSNSDDERRWLAISAFFTALVWLCLPVNTQPVIYIVQRMTTLMTLFYLLTFYLYLCWRESKRNLFLGLTFISFALSMISKENGITLPLAILLYELIFTHGGDLKRFLKQEKRLLSIISAGLTILLIMYSGKIATALQKGYDIRDFSMGERLLTQFRVLTHYLSLLIYPAPGRLSISHYILKSTSLFSPISTFFSFLLVVALFALAIVWRKKRPYLSFAILWYFVTNLVESSIIPLELMFDHRVYLPSIFIVGVAVDYLVRFLHKKNKAVAIAALCSVALLFGSLSYVRGDVWRDGISLWGDVMRSYPDDPRATLNLGVAYYDRRDVKEAEKYYQKAVDLWSASVYMPERLAGAYNFLADAQKRLGRRNKQKLQTAKQNYLKSIVLRSDDPYPHDGLGNLAYSQKKYSDAKKHYLNALKVNPNYVPTLLNYGELLFELGEVETATNNFSAALKLSRNSARAYAGLGAISGSRGDNEKALEYFNRALTLNPGNRLLLQNLRLIKQKLKQAN